MLISEKQQLEIFSAVMVLGFSSSIEQYLLSESDFDFFKIYCALCKQ